MVAIAGGDVAKDKEKEECYDGANGGEPPHLVVRQHAVGRNALEGDACAWDAPDKRGGEVEACAWHSYARLHSRSLWVIASLFVPVMEFFFIVAYGTFCGVCYIVVGPTSSLPTARVRSRRGVCRA